MEITKFRDPETGYEESISHAGLWCLLFGSIYFAVKGIWAHAVVSFVAAIATAALSWFVYPFFARQILERHYRKKGWVPVDAAGRLAAVVRKCPFCAEVVRPEAVICRHCRSQLPNSPRLADDMSQNAAISASTTEDPADPSRAAVMLGSLAIAAGVLATYWFVAKPNANFNELQATFMIGGLAIIISILSLGCWIRRRKFGMLELGALALWMVAVASATPLMALSKRSASSSPSSFQIAPAAIKARQPNAR